MGEMVTKFWIGMEVTTHNTRDVSAASEDGKISEYAICL
jgi:hypothetical protein